MKIKQFEILTFYKEAKKNWCGVIRSNGETIGTLKEHKKLGEYVFYPSPGALFTAQSAIEISKFLNQLNGEK